MQNDLDLSDIMQAQPTGVSIQLATDRHLGGGDAVIAALAAKTRASRFLASTHASEERLEGEVDANRDVLQHLRLHRRQRSTGHLEHGQRRLLVIEAQRRLPLFPSITAFGQQYIVQPAAFLKLLLKETLLLLIRVQTIFEHLTYVCMVHLKHACCQGKRAIHPHA